jgi:hypothetical protein
MILGLRLAFLTATLVGIIAPIPAAGQAGIPLPSLSSATAGIGPSQPPHGSSIYSASSGSEDPTVVARKREERARLKLSTFVIINIQNWRREGTRFRALAEWYGELVDLHVDAETGEIKQPERLKGTQVERMLRERGWGSVREVKRGGDTFFVRAERNGRIFDLLIEAKTGQIREAH